MSGTGKRKVAKLEDESASDIEIIESPLPKKAKRPAAKAKAVKKEKDDFVAPEDASEGSQEEDGEDVKPSKKRAAPVKSSKTSRKAKVEDRDEEDVKPPPSKRVKKEDNLLASNAPAESSQVKLEEDGSGRYQIPEGHDNCLAGITFVFTGELKSLDREGATQLAKRYGGRVTGAPSSKTTYVVIGEGAGASKLKKLDSLKGPARMSEEEFFNLILTRSPGDIDEKHVQRTKEADKKIKEDAKRMGPSKGDEKAKLSQLWTVKYAPKSMKDVCGNKGLLEKLKKWLDDWPKSVKSKFKKPGPDGLNCYRAILISGPPGIGKTTSAHLVARLAGYTVIELNASDTRSKKLLELGYRSAIDNTSLDGFFGGGSKKQFEGQPDAGEKAVLIMDEVDGMSGGDRGGVGALNVLIRKTKIPIICIANDSKSQKMKPLGSTCFSLSFKRPDVTMIRSRMMSIAYKEGIQISAPVVEQLINGAQSDIRSVINMMSTYALGAKGAMDFDKGKELVQSSVKNQLQNPFTLMDKLFSPYMFSASSKVTLNEKLELYFHDFSIMPLMVQENYLKHGFSRASNMQGRDAELKRIDLVARAAESISDGDVLDSMIHGSQQQWSLLPAHGMASTVRPAFFCYGTSSFGKGPGGFSSAASSRSFPGWLGKNSTTTRLRNALGEIQIRMRLNVSGDRSEIRQTYLPVLFQQLSAPLAESGADGIEKVIELMDEYFLTKDEWDTVMELGLGESSGEILLKGVASATKSSFTRNYNKGKHPIPFHKASEIGKPSKKLTKGDAPDLEDVIEGDDAVEDEEEPVAKDEQDDVKNDKLLKAKKPKAVKAPKAATTKKAATKAKSK